MQDFRKLAVWRKAYELTIEVYRVARSYPDSERYGLISQSQRAAASVPANIAEACGRESRAEMRRFLQIAMGSASELEVHLQLACDLAMLDAARYALLQSQLVELKRMLAGFIARVREKEAPRRASAASGATARLQTDD